MKLMLFILFSAVLCFGTVRHAAWPLENVGWNVNRVYPSIPYEHRLAVKGGQYPYVFTLISGPAGMTINNYTGIIKWAPTSETHDTVIAKVTDVKGDTIRIGYGIDCAYSGFYFVDSANGNNANNGSIDQPWKTCVYASATADSVSYVYIKNGTYIGALSIGHDNCGRFIAYPGDSVIITDTTTGGTSLINVNGGTDRLFQGLTIDANQRRWGFSISGSGYAKNIIWYKNEMTNVYSANTDNPAFIFFWDGSHFPAIGSYGMVVHNNIFHKLRNANMHGASVTCYDVRNMLYENNIAYDIDGRGFCDKDNGFRNTIRNNKIYDCNTGIALWSQYGSDSSEVNYNHVYNCTLAVVLGGEGWIKGVYVHHNTLACKNFWNADPIVIRQSIDNDTSNNINIYKNIIDNSQNAAYAVSGGSYPSYLTTCDTNKLQADSNLIQDTTLLLRANWGPPSKGLNEWRTSGFDIGSKINAFSVNADYVPILHDTLRVYGRFGADTLSDMIDTTTCGDTITYYAIPDFGYNFIRWEHLGSGWKSDTTNDTIKIRPDGTDTLQAIFEYINSVCTLTVSASAGGTISRAIVIDSSNYTFRDTATANTGYQFVNWTRSNTNVVCADSTSRFGAWTVIGNATITANFVNLIPNISSLNRQFGQAGAIFVCTGTSFGDSTATSHINFGAQSLGKPAKWTATEIRDTVPALARGNYRFIVNSSTGYADTLLWYTIKQPGANP